MFVGFVGFSAKRLSHQWRRLGSSIYSMEASRNKVRWSGSKMGWSGSIPCNADKSACICKEVHVIIIRARSVWQPGIQTVHHHDCNIGWLRYKNSPFILYAMHHRILGNHSLLFASLKCPMWEEGGTVDVLVITWSMAGTLTILKLDKVQFLLIISE